MKGLVDLGMKLWYNVKSSVARSSSNVKEPAVTPADLYELRKVVASAALLQRGDFDKELDRMAEEAQKTVAVASQEATRIRQQADSYLETIQEKSASLMEAVEKARTELNADRTHFEENRAAAEAQAEENQQALRETQKELATDREVHKAQVAELAPRLAEVARKESNLEAQLERTAALQAELTSRLERLRAAAA